LKEGRKAGRQEGRKGGRQAGRKNGRTEERKKGRRITYACNLFLWFLRIANGRMGVVFGGLRTEWTDGMDGRTEGRKEGWTKCKEQKEGGKDEMNGTDERKEKRTDGRKEGRKEGRKK
jgi:hypothetical protein